MSYDKRTTVIRDKMRCLDDFGICARNDKEMIAELREVLDRELAKNPGKDPEVILDIYCRPMIQQKVNSWVV